MINKAIVNCCRVLNNRGGGGDNACVRFITLSREKDIGIKYKCTLI